MMVLLNTVTFGPVPCLMSIPWFTAFVILLFFIMLFADPKFKIPFKVESANLSGDIDLDLTMSGKAKTVTKITDFFLCAALLVGLVFATKKLEF